jgi:hypothetical protein
MSEMIDTGKSVVDAVVSGDVPESAAVLALRLTERQWRWAEAFLETFDKNKATEVACDIKPAEDGGREASHYATINRMSNNLDVQAYIAARSREKALPADAVLAQYAEIAMGSIEDFLDIDYLEATGKPMFNLQRAYRDGKMRLVRRIRVLDKGGIELELYSRMEALDRLAKHLGLLQEQEVHVDNYQITIVRE